jgi:hypothetical protein
VKSIPAGTLAQKEGTLTLESIPGGNGFNLKSSFKFRIALHRFGPVVNRGQQKIEEANAYAT